MVGDGSSTVEGDDACAVAEDFSRVDNSPIGLLEGDRAALVNVRSIARRRIAPQTIILTQTTSGAHHYV